jgi:hypothetical protein
MVALEELYPGAGTRLDAKFSRVLMDQIIVGRIHIMNRNVDKILTFYLLIAK